MSNTFVSSSCVPSKISVTKINYIYFLTVTETTAEIVCIVCKDGASARPNEIVLCDKCGVGMQYLKLLLYYLVLV